MDVVHINAMLALFAYLIETQTGVLTVDIGTISWF